MRRIALMTVALALSGCAASPATEPETETTSEPETSESASAATDLDFELVAISSCDRAMAQGVEEITVSNSYRQVLVPIDAALDGYSAAWEDLETGEVGLIWEADAFLSCAAAITIGLAEEAGEEPNWLITATNGGFEVFQDFGEYGTQLIKFSAVEGFLVSAEVVGGENFTIHYGEPSVADAQQLIELAVSNFAE